jgi:hypothetical protein
MIHETFHMFIHKGKLIKESDRADARNQYTEFCGIHVRALIVKNSRNQQQMHCIVI